MAVPLPPTAIKVPDVCPPNKNDYNWLSFGSYAQRMLWRGFIPIAGPFLQHKVDPPGSCSMQNTGLRGQMQQLIAVHLAQDTDTLERMWQTMNSILYNVVFIGDTVTNLQTAPVQNQLLYLFAGTTALTLLTIAILLSF